jgi:hypothetical protein
MRLDSDSVTQASGSADAAAAYVTEALGNNCQVKIEWTNLSQIAGRHRFEPYLRKEGSSRTRPT